MTPDELTEVTTSDRGRTAHARRLVPMDDRLTASPTLLAPAPPPGAGVGRGKPGLADSCLVTTTLAEGDADHRAPGHDIAWLWVLTFYEPHIRPGERPERRAVQVMRRDDNSSLMP